MTASLPKKEFRSTLEVPRWFLFLPFFDLPPVAMPYRPVASSPSSFLITCRPSSAVTVRPPDLVSVGSAALSAAFCASYSLRLNWGPSSSEDSSAASYGAPPPPDPSPAVFGFRSAFGLETGA